LEKITVKHGYYFCQNGNELLAQTRFQIKC